MTIYLETQLDYSWKVIGIAHRGFDPRFLHIEPSHKKLIQSSDHTTGIVFKAVKSNDILTKLKTGLNFNLDMAELFSKKKKSQTQSGTVPYGLVLREINPDPNAPRAPRFVIQ